MGRVLEEVKEKSIYLSPEEILIRGYTMSISAKGCSKSLKKRIKQTLIKQFSDNLDDLLEIICTGKYRIQLIKVVE